VKKDPFMLPTSDKINGHDILKKHLKRFGFVSSATCNLCNEDEQDSEHLYSCPALDDIRTVMKKLKYGHEEEFSKLYWHAQELAQ
jgi:hypothetical protein